ncbi:MAG: hypothetical protein RL385_4780 [Pseudomonadota bacterium]|jgi:hypothetical protein
MHGVWPRLALLEIHDGFKLIGAPIHDGTLRADRWVRAWLSESCVYAAMNARSSSHTALRRRMSLL